MSYKPYSDSYLMSLTKPQIIELLRTAEHNYFTTEEALANSVKAGQEYAEKFDKAKELLKSAERIIKDVICNEDYLCDECCYTTDCDGGCRFKWKYEAEAIALIGADSE